MRRCELASVFGILANATSGIFSIHFINIMAVVYAGRYVPYLTRSHSPSPNYFCFVGTRTSSAKQFLLPVSFLIVPRVEGNHSGVLLLVRQRSRGLTAGVVSNCPRKGGFHCQRSPLCCPCIARHAKHSRRCWYIPYGRI